MGVPTSEVGYTSAMPRREDHEVHKRTCGGIGKKIVVYRIAALPQAVSVLLNYQDRKR
jgi:hypothetical protein